MALTNQYKAKLLDAIYGDTPVNPPATVYVGLSSTTPTQDGTNITEPNGGSYARVAVTNDGTEWADATVDDPSVKTNINNIEFPESTDEWLSSNEITHAVIFDSETGGEAIDIAELDFARIVNNPGIILRILAGEFKSRLRSPQ